MPSRRQRRQTGSVWRAISRSQGSGARVRVRVRVRVRTQTRRFFGGRQPLCGSGVTSSIALTVKPAACKAVIADSRPDPGPFTLTSISFMPNFDARSAQVSAARWAANGVLLRLPLKPTVPADAKQSVSPLVSVMVTMVLLNVALMWAMPRLTLRRALRFLLLATDGCSQTPLLGAYPKTGTGTSKTRSQSPFWDRLLPGQALNRAIP